VCDFGHEWVVASALPSLLLSLCRSLRSIFAVAFSHRRASGLGEINDVLSPFRNDEFGIVAFDLPNDGCWSGASNRSVSWSHCPRKLITPVFSKREFNVASLGFF
jgi:hypothetical protein